MEPAHIERLAHALQEPEIAACDPARTAELARSLREADPPASAGRHGALVGYVPGSRRRLLELDRQGRLLAFFAWQSDGRLGWAKCRSSDGRWLGIEPGAGHEGAWGPSDQIWLLDAGAPWRPIEQVTIFAALDYERLDRIPPLADPRRLGPGAGTALLNLLAGLMKDQGAARVRYAGPYPTEQLFTSLLESFRYAADAADPLERFSAGELDWIPAPHERHEVAPGVWVQLRHQVEKVVVSGVPFYRRQWQGIERREPRVVRAEGDRIVCSLWALGRSLEERLALTPGGELIERFVAAPDTRPPAPLAPLWSTALGAVIARESAPPLASAIAEVMSGLALAWGPVPGDLVAFDGARVTISRKLKDAADDWIARGARGPERAERAAALVLEVARLLAPAVRLRAQQALEALSEEEQLQCWHAATDAAAAPLDPAAGRLVALIAAGHG